MFICAKTCLLFMAVLANLTFINAQEVVGTLVYIPPIQWEGDGGVDTPTSTTPKPTTTTTTTTTTTLPPTTTTTKPTTTTTTTTEPPTTTTTTKPTTTTEPPITTTSTTKPTTTTTKPTTTQPPITTTTQPPAQEDCKFVHIGDGYMDPCLRQFGDYTYRYCPNSCREGFCKCCRGLVGCPTVPPTTY